MERGASAAARSAAVLVPRRLVASYPCPDKGDQAKADDPGRDDDPSDSHAVEYDGSLRDYYTREPYERSPPRTCSPRPNCCFFRPIFPCRGRLIDHSSKPRLSLKSKEEPESFNAGAAHRLSVRSARLGLGGTFGSIGSAAARARELAPSRPGGAVRGRHHRADPLVAVASRDRPAGLHSLMRLQDSRSWPPGRGSI